MTSSSPPAPSLSTSLTPSTESSTLSDSHTPSTLPSSSSGEQADLLQNQQPDLSPNNNPSRSHDPRNNLKRSDPFQFGSRYLLPTDDPYEFNAWDHVETDETYKAHIETRLAAQRAAPVTDFDRHRFNADPVKWWNLFYKNNTTNFFKDRKWLQQEFKVLEEVTRKGVGRKVVLEVGAGAGNTAFPVLQGNQNEELMVHACDFSKVAVKVMRESPLYDERHIRADTWDVASPTELPPGLEEGSVDVVVMVFIFSALNPRQWEAAVRNVYRLLKPGGEVCFRDYGRGDLAQVRFRKGRWMEENFYVRGDGTRVYFFEMEELQRIWDGRGVEVEDGVRRENGVLHEELQEGKSKEENEERGGQATDGEKATHNELWPAFEITDLGIDRRLIINRQSKTKMYRCWLQGRFSKPVSAAGGIPASEIAALNLTEKDKGETDLESESAVTAITEKEGEPAPSAPADGQKEEP